MTRNYLDPPWFDSRSILDIHTDASVVNSTAETTLATLALPTTLNAGDALRVVLAGDLLNNSGSGVNYTWTLKLGATTLHTLGAFSISASASRRTWKLVTDILIAGTSDERSSSVLTVSGGGTVAVSQHGMGRGTAAEDVTAGKNLVLTTTLGTAASTIDNYLHEAVLEVFKRP